MHAAEAFSTDKEVVLAAVAQDGYALMFAESALAQHTALQQIAHLSRHWALELAKKRLGLAVIASASGLCVVLALKKRLGVDVIASASGQVCTIAALSADIIELVGAHITRGTAIHSLVARHQYWPTCKPPPTKRHRS